MNARTALTLFTFVAAARAGIIQDVRQAIARNDFGQGEARIAGYRAQNGVTAEMLEALSWLGRGALAARQYDKADAYAEQTRALSLEMLKTRPLDAEKNLPIALGASIEVQANVKAARGERSGAIEFLNRELRTYRDTSIRTRIQKNIHLLSLEGKPAPALELKEWIGRRPQPLASLKGKPLLLFFWAHWCGDCKYQAPILARLKQEYPGVTIVGPTQRYGYAARGEDTTPAQEVRYIDRIRQEYYGALDSMMAPVSEENFKNYGASTTPTLVLVDAAGIVRLYHPGKMTYEELAPLVASMAGQARGSSTSGL